MKTSFLALSLAAAALASPSPPAFHGRWYQGRGDTAWLELLDISRRMFAPDPEFQNLSMLYTPEWNGLVEGPTWNMWWIQNSYGTSYAALPFLEEPFTTFLANSQRLWFEQMGDGRRPGCPAEPRHNWVAPDGALCDAARPGCIIYKQGDGQTALHDWGFEFTAAGVLLEAERLLIARDPADTAARLPQLERAADFVDSRRDPRNNLFLVGAAANLLAPSFAGWRRPDGTYGRAYLAGLSITYIAALDRLVELEKFAGRAEKARLYGDRRELARRGLAAVTAPEGYFIKSLDPDGTRHGVLGAARRGYFEASPNHDAIAFRVVDDAQARAIWRTTQPLAGLRPHGLILANWPSLDDMYTQPAGLWRFGHWVNGGHWSTCEGRQILAYYRLGAFEDARRAMLQILSFARRFRMDNPLTEFGAEVYQPHEPINITYDAFAPPAAMIRGLFEYLYAADSLTLVPHIPPAIAELHQAFPVRFGSKRLYLAAAGTGPVRAVRVNGRVWKRFDGARIVLPYAELPETARIEIVLGTGRFTVRPRPAPAQPAIDGDIPPELRECAQRLRQVPPAGAYRDAHARLALAAIAVIGVRDAGLRAGRIPPLPEASREAARQSYIDAAARLCRGLQ